MSESGERAALVTGGGSGIGRATARALVADGWRVAICGRRRDALEQTFDRLSDEDRTVVIAGDVADVDDARRVVDEASERFGRLDGLVNAHGIVGALKQVPDLTTEDWSEVLGVNLMGGIWTTTAAVPHLAATRGSVVNISSINAFQGEAYMAGYGVAKAGLLAFTRYAAADLAPHGIRVNAITPGWVHTPMSKPFFDELELHDRPLATNMLQRAARPEEIASAVLFLLGDGASFVTAEALVVDGGHSTLLGPLRATDS